MSDYQSRISAGDTSVFCVANETGIGDKRTIPKIQNFVASRKDQYHYVETGSYMGGSLVSHLLDERCAKVVSIDLRPDAQPDERGVTFDYSRSSTAAMLHNLDEHLPKNCLAKLVTFDGDASSLPDYGVKFDLCFIDGEHTNTAAFRDFISLWRWCAKDCVILFHDMNLVSDAISNVESLLSYLEVRHRSFCLPDLVFALTIGAFVDDTDELAALAFPQREYFTNAKDALWQNIARNYIQLGRV